MKKFFRTQAMKSAALLLIVFANVPFAAALPWDYDMGRQQSYKADEIARSPVKGTVPLGYKPFSMTNDEAGQRLSNPQSFTQDSLWRGRRLFKSNCVTCHGLTAKGDGPVGPQVAVPDIRGDFYKARTDGFIYGVLMNGGANMPRYGFKFSDEERWSLINYVRFLQGREMKGMDRPE